MFFRYGIILNYIGEFEGYRQQILNSYEIRKHFEKALAINDKDPTTWHLLGKHIYYLLEEMIKFGTF